VTNKRKLFLIDGNGLAYRAFYAVPAVHTLAGTPTNAVAGFFDLVIRLLAREKPTHVAVAFDKGVPTERVTEYQDFNAQRVELAEELAAQLPTIEDVVRGLGIQVFRVRGHQGDDCLGTLARKAADDGMDVLILSGDLDLLQLVGPRVQVMTFRRGLSDLVVYDEDSVKKRFNLLPSQLADLRALAGDSSDNITGVPGIGEVTAKKLLSQHGSLEELLASLDQLPAKWRNPLSENRDEALDFKTRAAIRSDLTLDVDWDRCQFTGVDISRVRDMFVRLELEEMLNALPEFEVAVHDGECSVEAELLVGKKGKTALGALAKKSKDPLNMLFLGSGDELVGLVVGCGEDTPKLVPFGLGEDNLTPEEAIKVLKPALKDANRRKNVHNLRGFLMLDLADGINPDCNFFDVAIASHLIDSVEGNPWFDEICRRHGLDIPGEGSLLGRGPGARKLSQVPLEELARWAGRRVTGLRMLAEQLEESLREQELLEHFQRVEMPMAWVFAQMEKEGVRLDDKRLGKFEETLELRLQETESDIYDLADGSFNLEDSKELAEVLFDKMGLSVASRPKNGSPIGADILAQVAAQNPIGERIRDYRTLKDLRHSFQYALPLLSQPRFGWFHRLAAHPVTNSERLLWMGPTAVGGAVSTFNRLLSEIEALANPELQAEMEGLLLSALVPSKKNHVLVGVSYCDLQLRLTAHLSEEQELIRSFVRGEDVESSISETVHNLEHDQMTPQMRRDGVDAVLGSIGSYRLARGSGTSPLDAEQQINVYLERFYNRFKGVRRYFEGQLQHAREQGWVVSIKGRRRNLPELSSRNSDIRSTAERVARNASIQASAADLIKAALVELHSLVRQGDLPAAFAMQLRDELILEIDPKHQSKVLSLVERTMAGGANLDVPVRTRVRVGENLAAARELEPVATR